MISVVRLALLAGCVFICGVGRVQAQEATETRVGPSGSRPTASLSWLAGCWEQRVGDRRVEERWLHPRGGLLLGVSRTTRGDSLVEYEFVRIYERADSLVFAAQPSGQPPAEFAGGELGRERVVFENPAHDFPQTIRYERVGADSLVARVGGSMGGEEREIVFRYGRVPCEEEDAR